MKYLPIDKSLFIDNRKKFAKKLSACSIAIFNSNDIMPTNGDGIMGFRQNSDLFYLCGIDQEETSLILFPESTSPKHKELLFIKETNEHLIIWEGNKLTKEEARKVSGIENIFWSHQLEKILHSFIFEAEHIYLNTNEHSRSENAVQTKDNKFLQWCYSQYPLHHYKRSAPIMHSLRSVKSTLEIETIKTACSITEKGFRRILPIVKPGIMEYEIEAELTYEFLKNRSRGHAYTPIIASGADACILHYIKNNKSCSDGELILLDVGAEYANYSSDMSRVIPVNGKFSKRQKEVYNSVLLILRNATKLLVIGNTFEEYTKQVVRLMEEELVKLNLISFNEIKKQDPENPLYKKYFMHGISHFLGLEVHDVGSRNIPFRDGMAFTCEPGIYIREE